MKRTEVGNPTVYKSPLNSASEKVEGPKVKTHRIVINLDDKNRFTDEVTV